VDPPIGELIRTADAGDPEAANALFAALYRELHAIAERQIRRGGAGLTLGTTTLLHEAYLNIASREGVRFADRTHFLRYAARAMRGLLIDYARRQRAQKRGGELHLTLSDADNVSGEGRVAVEEVEHLATALDTLAQVDPALAELVDLHFFAGFTLVEIAGLRAVSESTVRRDWRTARVLLRRALQA
jgi:RNA polymerase sigma factor (TIGR02999 family)